MTTLALDLGTDTGWAVRCADGSAESGVWKLPPKNRWHGVTHELNAIYAVHRPVTVVYEMVRRHLGTRAAHVYGGFEAMLEMWSDCADGSPWIRREYLEVGVAQSLCADYRKASKPMMIEAAQRLFPDQTVMDHNQADALCLLYTFEERAKTREE